MHKHLLSTLFLFMPWQWGLAQTVSTYAGNVNVDMLNGKDTNSTFNRPVGLAKDKHGNIYVTEFNNNAIRKVSPTGQVTTFASNLTVPALNNPVAITVDSNDNVYYANQWGHFIGRITPAGVASVFAGTGASGQFDTIASRATFQAVQGLSAAANGVVYVADLTKVRKIENGIVTTVAGKSTTGSVDGPVAIASFANIVSIDRDSAGNIYVADAVNWKVRKISTAGIVSTVAGSGTAASVDGTGTAASFKTFRHLCVDRASGNILLTELNYDKIRKVTPAGVVTTLAGGSPCGYANGTTANALFCNLEGIVTDTAGNIYVADGSNNMIRKLAPNGSVSTFVGAPSKKKVNGVAPRNSSFNVPCGLAFDSSGSLYISEELNRTIRKVTRAGVVTTFCGSGMTGNQTGSAQNSSFVYPTEICVNKKTGVVYVLDQGDNRIRAIDPGGNSSYYVGSGASGSHDDTGLAATLRPMGYMCIDTSGNLYFTDIFNNVRKVTPSRVVSTYARLHSIAADLAGVTIDRAGNLYVASRIPGMGLFRIDPAGTISTHFPGVSYINPCGLTCDARGTVYLAGVGGVLIFDSSLIAARMGIGGGSGYRDGPWHLAYFMDPHSLALDEFDSLYISDRSNNVVRKATLPLSPTRIIAIGKKPAELSILPNPNRGAFQISASAMPDNAMHTVSIVNAIGQTVYEAWVSSRDNRLMIDLRQQTLPSGSYFVTASHHGKKLSGRFILIQ